MAATKTQKVKQGAITVYRRAAPIVKKAGRAAGRAALEEKHTITALLAAAALGYADKEGIEVPSLMGLGKAGTAGAAAFVIAKMTKSRTARHVATGLLCVAAYELASTGTIK